MKALLIAVIMAALASCEVCEDCTCTTYNGPYVLSTTTTEVCGKKEIKATEGTTTATSGNQTVTIKCRCK